MNEIYIEISKLTDKFRTMAFGITTDENKINNAVQELMLYFLNMNPSTLSSIWEKDGKTGIIKYGAVALRRALTSTRSNFYYKYEKYYTNLYGINMQTSSTIRDCFYKSTYNLPQVEEINYSQKKLEQIDKELDKLENWYDRELFKLYYYEGNTLDSLASKTGISRNSLFTTIDKVRDILKKKLNE